MHISFIFLSALPLTFGLPLEPRDLPTPSSSDVIASPTPLTPQQTQTLSCICKAFTASGLTLSPYAAHFTSICALYPAGSCKVTPSTSTDQGTSLPLSGGLTSGLGDVGGLSNVASSLLGSLPIAKEKRDIEERQTTSSSTGGGLDLGGTNIPGLVLGATSVPEAADVLSGVASSAPGLLSTAGQVANLAGLGGVLARDGVARDGDDSARLIARDEVKEKRQDPLSGLTGALGGVTGGLLPGSNPVTGLVGSLTGGLTGGAGGLSGVTGGLTGGAGGLTGGLPVVGNGGLSGISGLAR